MFACLSNEQYLTWNLALKEKGGGVRGAAKGCAVFEKVAQGPALVNEVKDGDLNKTLTIEKGALACQIELGAMIPPAGATEQTAYAICTSISFIRSMLRLQERREAK